MYSVVEFDGVSGGGLGLVREEWLTPRRQQCFWPPFKLSQQYNKALKEGYVLDEKWNIFKLSRIFYSTDDILIARQKLKQAEEESDVVTDSEIVTPKRRRKINPKYISNDDCDLNYSNEELFSDNETNFDCDSNNNKEKIGNETNLDSVSLLDSLKRFCKPSKSNCPLPPRHSELPQPVETSVSVGSAFSNSHERLNSSSCSSNTTYDDKCLSQKMTEGFNVIASHLARLAKSVDDIIFNQESVINAAFPEIVKHNMLPSLPANIKLPCETNEQSKC